MDEITGGGLTAAVSASSSAAPPAPGTPAPVLALLEDLRARPSLIAGLDVITDAMARRIAMDWHGGQGSALYAFGSCGAIDDIEALKREISQECRHLERGVKRRELLALAKYVDHAGARPVIPRWAHGYDDTTLVTVAMC